MKQGKKVTQQSIIGQQGVTLIEQIVQKIGYVWRATSIFDVGIDGEIEIRDSITGEMTNTIIKVQAKATTNLFQAETANSFEYSCTQKDLNYWLRGNVPVILIVCRPDTDEAYWVSVRDYFSDLATQKTRKVLFDKQRNRFDDSCTASLKKLALSGDSGIYFAPLQKTETLYTNLLKVTSFASKMYVAGTNYRKEGAIWREFNSMGIKVGPEWILANKQIVSFHNLKEPPFNKICDLGTCKSFDTQKWSNSKDEDTKRQFVQLLNKCLQERTQLLRLDFNKTHQHYYFPPTRDPITKELRPYKVWYQSLQQKASREVFGEYAKKSDPSQRAYYRHSAFEGQFLQLGDEWYLEITPTYHFTSDGYERYKFRSQLLQGIKRLDRNPAVLGQLLMWADYLSRSTQNIFSSEYPFLDFGQLATVDINTSLPDDVWYNSEEENEVKSSGEAGNQLGLFD
ncbi:MAG: DUF4365 domain-containing protein [Candidatus Poribacteria bacterium]|nr:DUF4365 domain-containing protein [Candidatus Poribacteria bacterium]